MVKTWTCVLCGKSGDGYGNNPDPLAPVGRCCDACNFKVILARWAALDAARNE